MDILGTVLFLALNLLVSVLGEVKFAITDCSKNRETELVTLTSSSLSPYPVPVPGDVHVSGSGRANRDATGDLSLDVTIDRYLGFFWLNVPCVSDVGSCRYSNVCGMMEATFGNGTAGCPPQLRASNLPCTCPIPAGTYTINDAVFNIPELSGVWSWLAEGDYRVTAKLIDTPTGEEIACQHVELTIVDGHPSCSGFLCSIFG